MINVKQLVNEYKNKMHARMNDNSLEREFDKYESELQDRLGFIDETMNKLMELVVDWIHSDNSVNEEEVVKFVESELKEETK